MSGLYQEEDKDYGRNNLLHNSYYYTYYCICLCNDTYRIEILLAKYFVGAKVD